MPQNICLPEAVKELIEIIEAHGHEAFAVGGCVRDSLLGLVPKDWDLATSLKPKDLIDIFQDMAKIIETGIKHGTHTLLYCGEAFEITTYGAQAEPGEKLTLYKDLARRDFTINAMAYHHHKGLIDLYEGKRDLEEKVIRAVENPAQRFREDPLRMLRALRFVQLLEFTLHPNTLIEIEKNSRLIQSISPERIREELIRILLSPVPSKAFRLILKTGLLEYILPDLFRCVGFQQFHDDHQQDVFEHSMNVLDNTPPRLTVRLAALLHDIGKPNTFLLDTSEKGRFYGHEEEGERSCRKLLTELRFDKKTLEQVCFLVKFHMNQPPPENERALRRWVHRIGAENLEALLQLQFADRRATAKGDEGELEALKDLHTSLRGILQEKLPLKLTDLAISGEDLKALGMDSGPQMGRLLKALHREVVEEPSLNQREVLLKKASDWLQRIGRS